MREPGSRSGTDQEHGVDTSYTCDEPSKGVKMVSIQSVVDIPSESHSADVSGGGKEKARAMREKRERLFRSRDVDLATWMAGHVAHSEPIAIPTHLLTHSLTLKIWNLIWSETLQLLATSTMERPPLLIPSSPPIILYHPEWQARFGTWTAGRTNSSEESRWKAAPYLCASHQFPGILRDPPIRLPMSSI